MPPRKPPKGPRPKADAAVPKTPGPTHATVNAFEQGLNVWTRFARETGETVTEFLHKFGDEQQKNYVAWAAKLSEAGRPKLQETEAPLVRARFDEWNRQADELGRRIREAFERSFSPQRELFEQWVKPFVPADASLEERNREMLGLVQKLWSGLTVDLTQRLVETMRPEAGFDEFLRSQEESTRQFADNFQKLARLYFTSPGFVAGFGKSLDSSLDLQKNLQDSDEFFRRVTGLPTRREISELNHAVRDLSDQVARLQAKRT
jgi:hypothetical protein